MKTLMIFISAAFALSVASCKKTVNCGCAGGGLTSSVSFTMESDALNAATDGECWLKADEMYPGMVNSNTVCTSY